MNTDRRAQRSSSSFMLRGHRPRSLVSITASKRIDLQSIETRFSKPSLPVQIKKYQDNLVSTFPILNGVVDEDWFDEELLMCDRQDPTKSQQTTCWTLMKLSFVSPKLELQWSLTEQKQRREPPPLSVSQQLTVFLLVELDELSEPLFSQRSNHDPGMRS